MDLVKTRRRRRLPESERLRRERELSALRLFVATAAVVQYFFIPPPPGVLGPAVIAYCIAALVAVLAIQPDRAPVDAIGILGEAIDMLIAVALLRFGTGLSSMLVPLVALIGAAHRWGIRGALNATAAGIGLILATAALVPGQASVAPVAGALGGLLAQCAFVLFAGAIIGYLTESADRLRLESESVAAVMTHADARLGLKHTMAIVFDAVVGRFNARRAVLVVKDITTDRVFMWQGATLGGATAEALRVDPLDPGTFNRYVALPEAQAWSAVPRAAEYGVFDVVALNAAGELLPRTSESFPTPFLASIGTFDHLLGFTIEHAGEWTARLFLIDPRVGRRGRREAVELGHRILCRICPAVDNASLVHRLRSRSAADERTRIARELHDGVIQAMLGVEIQLHTVAAGLDERSQPVADDLNRLAGLLRDEVLNLRDMMQRMQPPELPPERLVETLSDLVQRFQYETGIAARFSSQFDKVDLSPRACRELTRVVQEALVNVRKHSGARSVFVQFTCHNNRCHVSVDDDGRGFPVGVDPQNGDGRRRIPRIIRERVHLLGGDVTVESAPQQGARVAISIPQSGPYAVTG